MTNTWPGSIAQSVARLTAQRSRDRNVKYHLGHLTLVEIDHEITSTIILPLPLILEEQLPVTGESMCISTG